MSRKREKIEIRKEKILRNEGIQKYDTKENAVRGDEKDFLENIISKRIRVNFHLVAHMKTSEKEQERDDEMEDDTHDG